MVLARRHKDIQGRKKCWDMHREREKERGETRRRAELFLYDIDVRWSYYPLASTPALLPPFLVRKKRKSGNCIMHVSSLSRIDSFLRVIKKFLLRAFEICTAIPLYYSPLLGYDLLSPPPFPSLPSSSPVHCTRARSISRIVSCIPSTRDLRYVSKHIISLDDTSYFVSN